MKYFVGITDGLGLSMELCHQLKMWQISAQFLPQLLTNKKNQFLAPQTWL
jgi:hypothetical protein